jgi:hypothetical protein
MPVPAILFINPQNTQTVKLNGLKDIVTGNFLDSAVITATLYDQYGNADSIFNNITLNYVPGSSGNYLGIVSGVGFSPMLGSGYKLKIDANQGGILGHWEILVQIKQRSQ